MPSALYTKSKVCNAALSAGLNFIWHAQLAGSWGLQLKLKPPKPKKKKENKTAMRFWRRVKACSLTLESAAWQWTSSPCSDHHRQKDSTQTFKKHQDFSPKNTFTNHTHLSWLSPPPPPLWFSHLILKYWTDIWTFLFSIHRDPLNSLLSLSSSFPSFLFFLLAHLLWVGSANALLVSDPLADQILRCLRGGWRPCYGNFTVPSTRNELSLFGDLDAGSC